MTPSFSIRPALLPDAEQLAVLGKNTFITFMDMVNSHGNPLPPHELEDYLQSNFTPDPMRAELSNPNYYYLLAIDTSGAIVGYLKIRPCALPLPKIQPTDYEIQRLYVDQRMQGKGIGRSLMDKAYATLRSISAHTLYLGSHEGNAQAKAFYEKLGFTLYGQYIFHIGDRGYINLIYRMSL